MKLNLKRPLAFFDLETTGVNVASDRIIEIAVIKVHPDGRIERKPDYSENESRLLINPTIPIPAESSMVHGIYDEHVKDAPTFAQISKKLFMFLYDCDLAGFNSNKFDVPLLAEEFLRCGIDFSIENRNLIDVQNIFHLMEQRTLKAGYKFYCQKELTDAHQAMADVEATFEIFLAQLQKYENCELVHSDGTRTLPVVNDMEVLHQTSQRHQNADMMGRIVFNEEGIECFNFGKHRGRTVAEVLRSEPGYYGWMMNGDFPLYTKKVLKEIRDRLMQQTNQR